MKELEDTGPANEAQGQNTTSASHMKLLENGRDFEASTARESNTDVDVDDVDCEISAFWLHKAWFQKMSVERRSLNLNNIIPMPPTKFLSKRNNHGSLNLFKDLSSFLPLGRFYCNVDVCLFQVVMTHCYGKLTHANICQCKGDF